MSLAIKAGMAGEQVGRRIRSAGGRLIRRGVREVGRAVGRRVRVGRRRRRRRARGISGAELRGFRKVIRLLANFTGIAPQRLARRVRQPRRRF